MTSPHAHTRSLPKEQFLRLMEEILDLDANTLKGPELLRSMEDWDSMAVLEFIAMADGRAGVTLNADAIAGCKTFDDLYALIEN